MSKLTLNLLGPVQIALDGEPIAGFAYSRSRVLLIYLALESACPQRRELLATLLWPDQAAPEARHSLRQTLATLRREIDDAQAQPPRLLTTRETIQFNPASDTALDVRAFEELLASAAAEPGQQTAECLERAVALYRGDLLEQFGLPDSPEFDKWVEQTRERLRKCALKALEDLALCYERFGAFEQLQRVARRWLELDPWCEPAHRCMMLALARCGQRAAALLQYETCRRILAEELGLDLEPATTALCQRIRAVPEAREEPGVRLPALPNRLIGRACESAAVGGLLLRDDVRLVTLIGTPGIGKTSLALHVAAELSGAFADGVCFVGLAPLDQAAQVLPAVAAALGVEEGEQALVVWLRRRRVLLLLDNWEHLSDAAPLLAELLAVCPLLKVLATSRAPLHIRAERRYTLQPLALPAPAADLAAITESAAVTLFVDRASASATGFALSVVNARAVAAICARLDGLPLAIELVATRVESLTPEVMLEQLDHSLGLLADGPCDLPARQRTLCDAISWSYARLPPHEQTVFAWLGVFRGGFDLEAAQTIIGACPHAVEAALHTLADKSLLQRAPPSDTPARFYLLETLRAYALDRLAASGAQSEAQRRHAACYAALAEEGHIRLSGVGARCWRQRIERDHDNLRAALAWLLEHDPELALRVTGALGMFWSTCGYHSEGRRWLALALARGGDDSRARACALQAAATLATEQGLHAEALRLAEASLALYRVLGDLSGAAWALTTCAWSTNSTSDPGKVEQLFTESLELFRQAGDTGGAADVLLGLAYIARQQDQFERAGALLREAIQMAEALGHLETVAFGRYVQCGIDLHQGLYEAAARHASEALEMYQRLGKRRDSVQAQGLLGEALWLQGQIEPAHAIISATLVVFEELGLQEGTVGALHMLGQSERRLGLLERAAACYRRSLTMARELGLVYFAARCVTGLGLLALAQADLVRAAVLLGAGFAQIHALPPFLAPGDWAEYEQAREELWQMLEPDAFERAWRLGQMLTFEQADTLALHPEMLSLHLRAADGLSSRSL